MNKNQFLVLVFCLSLFACGGLKKLETYIEKATTPAAKPKPPAPEPPGGFVYSKAGLIFPVPGKGRKDIISKFGDPRDGGARIHEGIDIAAPRGTAVLSVSNGKVISVKDEGRGGKQVWIKDTDREYVYYYAHLNSQSVQEGDRVMTGTEIGTVGNTGNAKGATPHLHFGIYENDWLSSDDVLDPLPLMP